MIFAPKSVEPTERERETRGGTFKIDRLTSGILASEHALKALDHEYTVVDMVGQEGAQLVSTPDVPS